MKRVFLTVLDSFGIGEAADAKDFGDEGANTLKSIADTGILNVPNLISLGLGNIDGVSSLPKTELTCATVGRLRELSKGKDTTTGHWEIAGLVSKEPMPTYPNGFPKEVTEAFETAVGRKILCNLPYSGTAVINDYGEEHLKTGALIVYTSADSVFQIAAHESIVSTEELYKICEIARGILVGKHGVGRVIARPFTGEAPNFVRTANRRDFSLIPPKDALLNRLKAAGKDVIGVGKIGDIFAMSGITESHPTHGNTEGMEIASSVQKRDFEGLCFINLVDFDMLYGHRRDAVGYANALNEFDGWLGGFMSSMKEEDMLIITADHGCDPTFKSTDHTREYVPYICYGRSISPKNIGTVNGFDHISKVIADYLL
ncbi:MAG: phosphopentomutase [Clostridia bacterium]|nr:phosphopentomutase [Clostridia bacterium]